MPAAPLYVRYLRSALVLALSGAFGFASAAGTYPVTPDQRATAERVASAGVPLSELAPDAPDTYTIKSGDTLWDISKLFLKTPWRWPELWGMNKAEIANPHLIEPFLTEAVVFDTDALAKAPRVVAAPEGHVMLTKGDLAYARGDLSQATDYRVFREARPLKDPDTGEVLGYEAPYLGTAELIAPDSKQKDAKGREEIVPGTLRVRSVRQEIGIGDRLAPVEQREFLRFVPHAPANNLSGRIVSLYGEALNGGQNQVVALNKGSQDGLERGHVLALWKAGRTAVDRTDGRKEDIRLPDTRSGVLLVFQTYKRVSYALIISAQDAIVAGDRFSPP